MSKEKSYEGRRIYWRTVMILALILITVVGAGFRSLYLMSMQDTREHLIELVQAQARIMESVAKFDAFFQSGDVRGAARSATLSQFKEGNRSFQGFGRTGEIMLGERIGDEIVFLLPSRKLDFQTPPPVNTRNEEAGPMQEALKGRSGTIRGRDYSGDAVLAAYEWLPFLEMGLVCKMDMAEINAPFKYSALITAAVALLAILVGAALNARAVSPLIERIVKSAAIIRERDTNYRELVSTIPGVVYEAETDEQLTMREMSGSIKDITGRNAEAFIDNAELNYPDIVLPEDSSVMKVSDRGAFSRDYRILRPDGSVRWIADHGIVVQNDDGKSTRKGILLDITARKAAEAELEELHRKLSRYISPQVYNSIFQGRQDAQVGSTRKKLTIFFSDVVNFTRKSENLDPDDLSFILNSYLNSMAEIATSHGGTLDKFIGDGVVVFFGDPDTLGVQQDATACVSMALEMMVEVESLNQVATRHGINSPIEIRIGIATGFCTVGNFGSESRMDYTVLGKTVNLAARLEAAAPARGVLVAEETALLIQDEFVCKAVQPISAKGFENPVQAQLVEGKRK